MSKNTKENMSVVPYHGGYESENISPDMANFYTKLLASTKKVHHCITQTPSQDNGHIALNKIFWKTDALTVTQTGIASPDMLNGSTNATELMELAERNAVDRAVHMHYAVACAQQAHTPMGNYTPQEQSPKPLPQEKEAPKYKHSPTKPISEGQMVYVRNIAKQLGMTVEELSMKELGKNVNQLSSADANLLINSPKKYDK